MDLLEVWETDTDEQFVCAQGWTVANIVILDADFWCPCDRFQRWMTWILLYYTLLILFALGCNMRMYLMIIAILVMASGERALVSRVS